MSTSFALAPDSQLTVAIDRGHRAQRAPQQGSEEKNSTALRFPCLPCFCSVSCAQGMTFCSTLKGCGSHIIKCVHSVKLKGNVQCTGMACGWSGINRFSNIFQKKIIFSFISLYLDLSSLISVSLHLFISSPLHLFISLLSSLSSTLFLLPSSFFPLPSMWRVLCSVVCRVCRVCCLCCVWLCAWSWLWRVWCPHVYWQDAHMLKHMCA